LATTFALAATGFGFAASALAATAAEEAPTMSWEVVPAQTDGQSRANFDLSVEPGQTIVDSAVVRNLGDADLLVSVYAADAYTTAEGALTLRDGASDRGGLASWTVAEVGSAVVPARGEVTVPFTITVPTNASPGDYVAGLVAQASTEQTTSDGKVVLVNGRVASRVYLRVPGELVPALRVTDVSIRRDAPWWNPFPADTLVDVTIENTGNARMTSQANARITGPFGWDLAETGTVTLPELLPDDVVTISQLTTGDDLGPLIAAGVASLGLLQADVAVRARVSGGVDAFQFSADAVVWDVPWIPVGILVLLILALVIIVLRRRRAARRTPASEPVSD
jgi:hypothetical protein